MTRLRLRTAGRLHFGLLGWGPHADRQFGSVGLMIESPGVELTAEPSAEWKFEGPLAGRVRDLVHRLRGLRPAELADFLDARAARLQVRSAPAEHVGLGVGTQLSLAVVRALLEMVGVRDLPPTRLAELSGRGRRSGIGLHGFLRGGLLVDGGRRDEATPPPLIARLPFPNDWSILIVQPPDPPGRSGHDEVRAFAEMPAPSDRVTERLCRLTLLGILPAVAEADLAAFGAAVSEMQQHVGAVFAPLQGGPYHSPRSAALISELPRLGLVGAGQSSWGPTLYAFGRLPETEREDISTQLRERFSLRPSELSWTKGANHAARLGRIP